MSRPQGRAGVRRLNGIVAKPVMVPGGPASVLAAWPSECPLVALWSGALEARRSRWTILAAPVETAAKDGPEAAAFLDGLNSGRTGPPERGPETPPFCGGWIGYLGYGLGGVFEPAARTARPTRDDRGWPDLVLHRCPAAYVHDGLLKRWWAVGTPRAIGALPRLDAARPLPGDERDFALGRLRSEMGAPGYRRAVGRALRYILDGDIYQVSLAHRLSARFSGSARAFFAELMAGAGPWYGGYIEVPGASRRILVSASPELFLEVDGSRGLVVTRPMKGTRPLGAGAGALERSEKDRAELAMIVDLMRNDLGRVCRFGSVRVEEDRAIESHGGSVWQGVASVRGVLKAGVGIGDLLGAAFPGGSVTGAPKIRAMQIIDELEERARGPYCGAFGFLSDCGNATLAMSIRTALIEGPGAGAPCDSVGAGRLDYWVGAGIVADSDPGLEWDETLAKAAILECVRPAQGAAR